MENKELLKFLGGGFWQISKEMRKAFGIKESLWITHLLNWQEYLIKEKKIKEDDFFFLSQENIFEETGVSPETQTIYIKNFIKRKILSKKQLPDQINKNLYYIDAVKMIEMIHFINKGGVDPGDEQQVKRGQKKENYNKMNTQDIPGIYPIQTGCNTQDIPAYNNNKENIKSLNKKDTKVSSKQVANENLQFSTVKKIEQEIPPTKPLSDAEQIFDFWNMISTWDKTPFVSNGVKIPANKDFKPFPTHNKTLKGEPTKIFTRAIHQIEIRLTRFTKEQIADAIALYAEMLSNPNIYILKKKFNKSDLDKFFKIEKIDKDSMQDFVLEKHIDSWFDECAKGEQYLLSKYGRKPTIQSWQEKLIEDQYPKITERFRQVWKEKTEKDKRYISFDGDKNENGFRKASIFLTEFFKKWYDHLPEQLPLHHLGGSVYEDGYLSKPHTLVHDFFNAIDYAIENMDNPRITPSWLSTPAMEKRLIDHYRNICVMADPRDDEDEKYDMSAYNL